jgi:hypothetical protein
VFAEELNDRRGISRVVLLHRHGHHAETLRLNSGEVPFEQNGHQSAASLRPLTPRHSGALLPSGGRVAGPEHDDFRADWRAVVEIDDVLVRQADTAGRDVGANRPGFIGAVDAV